jgi:hypothetical protein
MTIVILPLIPAKAGTQKMRLLGPDPTAKRSNDNLRAFARGRRGERG